MSRRLIAAQREADRKAKAAAEAPILRARAVRREALERGEPIEDGPAIKITDVGELGWRLSCGGASAMAASIPAALRKLAADWPESAPEALLRGYEPRPAGKPAKTKTRTANAAVGRAKKAAKASGVLVRPADGREPYA